MKKILIRLSIFLFGSTVFFYPFIGVCQNNEDPTAKEFQKFLGTWQGTVDINEKASNSILTSAIKLVVHSVQYEDVSFTIIKSRDGKLIDSVYFRSSGAAGESALGLIIPATLIGGTNRETVLQLRYDDSDGDERLRGSRGGLTGRETMIVLRKVKLSNKDLLVNANNNTSLNGQKVFVHPDTAYTKPPEKSKLSKVLDAMFRGFDSLSPDDKLTIFKSLRISPDYISLEHPGLKYNLGKVFRSDFNNDGILEVLVELRSMNSAQNKTTFFVKPSLSSSYTPVLISKTPEAPVILLERNLGYNNLYVDDKGMGKVLRWDGAKYSFYKTIDKSIIFKGRNTMDFEEVDNHYYNKERFPDSKSYDLLATIEELKDLRGRNPNAKKGSPSKFIGGWWVMGYYKLPIFIKRSGTRFAVSDNKFVNVRIMDFNIKNDRLEGWVEKPGIKVKFVIEYNYDYDRIIIRPEAKEAGMVPMSLMRYK
jgi:hypothetical protein